MLSLSQRLSQQQKLSPQQIQYQKLLQLKYSCTRAKNKDRAGDESDSRRRNGTKQEQDDKEKEKEDEY